VLGPGAAVTTFPWRGWLTEGALAGGRVAFIGSRRRGTDVMLDELFVADLASGAVEASAKLRPEDDFDDGHIDLRPDGRAIAALDDRLLTVAPGAPPASVEGDFRWPRFSGDGVAVLKGRGTRVATPTLLAPDGTARALGSPSSEAGRLDADDRGVTWIANGCVLYAARDTAPPAEPPAGLCPRSEVLLGEGGQTLRGRRVRVRVTCVAAPAAGCIGTVLLGRRGRLGRRAFHLASGTARTLDVRLSARGMRRVRMRMRSRDTPFPALSARVRDGRAYGVRGVVIDRVR
jgi:hypothetical protein